jgi:tetratricopeptide (TPR) repeat protein
MPAAPNNRNKKKNCTRITDQTAQLYFAGVLPPTDRYELSIHLINCEDCFPVIQKWGRLTGNGNVDIINKILLEYRTQGANIISNDGTISSVEQLLNQLFGDNPSNVADPVAEMNPKTSEISQIKEKDEVNANQPALINKLARDLFREKHELMQQISQERAEIQQTLEKTLAELARITRERSCPHHQEIMELLKGELLGERWNLLDDHLADCPVCQQYCSEIIGIYSLQQRREIARQELVAQRAHQAAINELIVDESVAVDSVSEAMLPETEHSNDLPIISDIARTSRQKSEENLAQTEKGSTVRMAITLTKDRLLNRATIVKTASSGSWPRRSFAAGIATLMLLGGIGYYFSLPPIPPTFNHKGASLAINPANKANVENELDSSDLDSIGQASVPARPLTPELIKEIEGLVKHQASDQAQKLLTPALKQAETRNDRVSQAKLLYLQGRIYSDRADFAQAIVTLKQAIAIATSLNKPELSLAPEMNLANIYHVTDQNSLAATHANRSLTTARLTKNLTYELFSIQMLAISDFLAYRSASSEKLLKESLTLAKQCNLPDRLIYGRVYLGLIQVEERNFAIARDYFQSALDTLKLVSDFQQRNLLAAMINGYYARTQAMSGRAKQAITLYNLAIRQAHTAKIRQNLALSQMYQGLAGCYRIVGNQAAAEEKFIASNKLERKAQKFCEISNTALSFAIVRTAARPCS